MLSTISSQVIRSAQRSPKFLVCRAFTTTDKFKTKEKVAEDIFMKEQEKKFFEKKRAEKDAMVHEAELKVLARAMAEVENALKKSEDKVSDAGLEAIARWKLNL